MNKQQLAMLDDISNKLEKRISDQGTKNNKSGQQKGDGVNYNPIVHLELSQFKKHNSVNPNKKDVSNIDYKEKNSDEPRPGELVVVKSKRTFEKELSKDKEGDKKDSDDKQKNDEKKDGDKDSFWNSECLFNIAKFLDSTPVIIFMTVLTIFAMFASDTQAAFLSTDVDFPFDMTNCILFSIFTTEIILASISKKNYIGSFFFWLDVVSTLSLLQDISFILDNLLTGYNSLNPPQTFDEQANNGTLTIKTKSSAQATNSIAKLSSATRATRVLRIIRIVRLIRIVKLYKSALLARANLEKKKKEKEKAKALEKANEERSGQSDDNSNSRSIVRMIDNPQNQENIDGDVMSPEVKRLNDVDPISNIRLKEQQKKAQSKFAPGK